MEEKEVVYANTPLKPDNKDHARIIEWRDREGKRNKSETLRKLATGGGILMDAGLLDLVISLEKMPGVDAKKALLLALASAEKVDLSATEMLERSELKDREEKNTRATARPTIAQLT